jgi:hypothetical protein
MTTSFLNTTPVNPNPMPCRICPHPIPPRNIYCVRCLGIVDAIHKDRSARCRALIPAYDPPNAGFHCLAPAPFAQNFWQ